MGREDKWLRLYITVMWEQKSNGLECVKLEERSSYKVSAIIQGKCLVNNNGSRNENRYIRKIFRDNTVVFKCLC